MSLVETSFFIYMLHDLHLCADRTLIYHCKTGDALLLPRLTNHKPLILGPRVTLSLGANPLKAMTTKNYGPVNSSM